MKVQIVFPLIQKSAKKSFKILRERGPFYCGSLDNNIVITKLFFNHITTHQRKKRNLQDLIERLLIIPFIDEIINSGNIVEERNKENNQYFRISKEFNKKIYSVIILIRENRTPILYSCFIDT